MLMYTSHDDYISDGLGQGYDGIGLGSGNTFKYFALVVFHFIEYHHCQHFNCCH